MRINVFINIHVYGLLYYDRASQSPFNNNTIAALIVKAHLEFCKSRGPTQLL